MPLESSLLDSARTSSVTTSVGKLAAKVTTKEAEVNASTRVAIEATAKVRATTNDESDASVNIESKAAATSSFLEATAELENRQEKRVKKEKKDKKEKKERKEKIGQEIQAAKEETKDKKLKKEKKDKNGKKEKKVKNDVEGFSETEVDERRGDSDSGSKEAGARLKERVEVAVHAKERSGPTGKPRPKSGRPNPVDEFSAVPAALATLAAAQSAAAAAPVAPRSSKTSKSARTSSSSKFSKPPTFLAASEDSDLFFDLHAVMAEASTEGDLEASIS
jgi:hypothetical protein